MSFVTKFHNFWSWLIIVSQNMKMMTNVKKNKSYRSGQISDDDENNGNDDDGNENL